VDFTYNGAGQRVRVVSKDDGITQNDILSVWCDGLVCEERSTSDITRRFSRGDVTGDDKRFFSADHLGSVREMSDLSGTLLARYEFDPWGRVSASVGNESLLTNGFAGFEFEPVTGLWLAQYRSYDSALGVCAAETFSRNCTYYKYADNVPSLRA
jgi:hypothetical protein